MKYLYTVYIPIIFILTISYSCNNKDNISNPTVPLNANFFANKTEGPRPLTVQFIDTSEPALDVISWSWNFGDGTGSTGKNPQHTYEICGVYTVVLTVSDSVSEDSEVKYDYINANPIYSLLLLNLSCRVEFLSVYIDYSLKNNGDLSIGGWDIEFTCFNDGGIHGWEPLYSYTHQMRLHKWMEVGDVVSDSFSFYTYSSVDWRDSDKITVTDYVIVNP